ncbi:MAG: hypothetical protein J6J36_07495 [Clostridia bacterium]|nr:hypothetical protein [Clostridia bacterium]
MNVFDSIKHFFDRMFNKNEIKMLPAGEQSSSIDIDISSVIRYMDNLKYKQSYSYAIENVNKSVKRKLIARMDSEMKGNPNWLHDDTILEGTISIYNFLAFKKRNVASNRRGVLIYSENGYFDITENKTEEKDSIIGLQYKSYEKDKQAIRVIDYDELLGSYKIQVKISGITYIESAEYAQKESLEYLERYAQPSYEGFNSQKYAEDTGLKIILNNKKFNIRSSIRGANPYLVEIELKNQNKNTKSTSKKIITKVYRSKKECVVGYKPIMIFSEEFGGGIQTYNMYRLLEDKTYIDNQTYKLDSDNKSFFEKISLDEVRKRIGETTFSLSENTKKCLKEGLELPNHIKMIFNIAKQNIVD